MSLMIEQVEQCVCLRCGGGIPREAVEKRIDRKTGEHSLIAYCTFCDVVYVLGRREGDRDWRTGVTLASGRERVAFLAKIAMASGTVRADEDNTMAARRLLAQRRGPAPVEVGYGDGR